MSPRTKAAIIAAADAWDSRATAWWTGRGRTDATGRLPPLFRVTTRGVVARGGDVPDDWSAEYLEAAARVYVEAYDSGLA